MGDPLSIGASTTGLLSLGIQVTQSLVDYYTSFRGQDAYIDSITQKLGGLLLLFNSLNRVLSDRKFLETERSVIEQINNSINSCEAIIHELEEEIEKIRNTPRKDIIEKIKLSGRRAAYPFRRSTLEKLDEDIREIRQNISLAQEILQLADGGQIRNDIDEVKDVVNLMRSTQLSQDLSSWLKAPDATANHNEAASPGAENQSCVQLRFSTHFDTREETQTSESPFFYFTFNDASKQSLSNMLSTLLHQLSGQLDEGEKLLGHLKNSCNGGAPSVQALTEALKEVIQKFQEVYILVDALDESPLDKARPSVLRNLQDALGWQPCCLHVFVTSRDIPDIRIQIQDLGQEISMKNEGVDEDIADFVSNQLEADPMLRRWSDYHDRIKDVLTTNAHGVFRWVECQFKSLASCPRSKAALEKRLCSLPQSLDETYEKMLLSIPSECTKDAKKIFTMLCFAKRPMSVEEIIDGVTVQLEEDPHVDLDFRMQDENDILQICPGFIDVSYVLQDGPPSLRIAHFSVQEYLESSRILEQKAAYYGLEKAAANAEIAKMCLIYLLDPAFSSTGLGPQIFSERPLAKYAAFYWPYHYSRAGHASSHAEPLAKEFFHCNPNNFQNWTRMRRNDLTFYYTVEYWSDEEEDLIEPDFAISARQIPPPLYYASLLGFYNIVQFLLANGSSLQEQSGGCFSALQVASWWGRSDVVKLLLDKGADINVFFGSLESQGNGMTPLMLASMSGHEATVKMLLERHDIDVNAVEGGKIQRALMAAAQSGMHKVVRVLLDRSDINVNAQDDEGVTALMAAIRSPCAETVRELLTRNDVDVNVRDNYGDTALMQAVGPRFFQRELMVDEEAIVNLLLERGDVKVNRRNNSGNTPLIEAIRACQDDRIIRPLLEHRDVDVNAQNTEGITALVAAAAAGLHDVLMMLLERDDIDVNARGKDGVTALIAAAAAGRHGILMMLLERDDIDVNARDKDGVTALMAAAALGHHSLLMMLLEHDDIDVDARNKNGPTALMVAAAATYQGLMRDDIDEKARNKDRPKASMANTATTASGRQIILRGLLELDDIHVNAKDKDGKTALMYAVDHRERCQKLLLVDQEVAKTSVEQSHSEVDAAYGKVMPVYMEAICAFKCIIELLQARSD